MAGSVVACGGGGDDEADRSDATSSTSAASDAGGGPSSTSAPDSSTTSTTTPLGDLIDVAGAPPVLFAANEALFLFEDLLEPPGVRVGSLENGEGYLVSPDGQVAAVGRSGDAVRPARVELISTESGDATQTFEVDSDSLRVEGWSSDSQVVLVRGDTGLVAYRVDGSVQEIENQSSASSVFVLGGSATSAVDCDGCSAVQLATRSGEPVAAIVAYSSDGRVSGTWDPSNRAVVPFDGVWGTTSASVEACVGFTVLSASIDGERRYAVYDVDTGEIVELEGAVRGACPVPANSESLAAVALADGGVTVVDTAAGSSVVAARQGYPLAWSQDDTEVLVTGNGTFVVAADGSGGNEASIEIASLCPIGTSGTALVGLADGNGSRGGELAIYDIATDSATSIGPFALGQTCEVSEDGLWALSDINLFDLDSMTATTLTRRDEDERVISGDRHFVSPSAVGTRSIPSR